LTWLDAGLPERRGCMKSNASDLLELWAAVYEDAAHKCSADVSDLRDLHTVRSRVKAEGLSFLTITLPQFARDFERSLECGQISSTLFRSFRKAGAIPAFLQGMLSLCFDRETGRKLNDDNDSPVLVEAVRQVCLLFKKLETPCTPARERAAIEAFAQVEREFSEFSAPEETSSVYREASQVLWDNIMLGSLHPGMLDPQHGPGATAERIMGNQKYVWRRWHERLEPFFPFLGTAYTVSAALSREFEAVTFVPEEQEQPVRVVTVPKTLKAPRIIAVEPVCMQYTQQALRACLYDAIEENWLTRGHVNFRDQKRNQVLAIESSISGQFVTIDLSDASDRVPNDLVFEMLSGVPEFRDVVMATRSTRAELPDGRVIGPLRKFASMGSALCFPVEAMYFYTVAVVALLVKRNLPADPINVYNVSRGLYVYGDDLIVPTDDADAVLDSLRQYNAKVNDSKTFLRGNFRESCGVDAYCGHEVTPTYVRQLRPRNRQQAAGLLSWVATANLFYQKGYWRAASHMFSTCEKILGPLPYVSPDSPALGRVSFLGYRSANGWSADHQSLRVKAWVATPVYSSDIVDGYSALYKSLQALDRRSRGEVDVSELEWGAYRKWDSDIPPPRDKYHLERTVRRGAVTLTRRWVPVT
jgi:hypothetical protein